MPSTTTKELHTSSDSLILNPTTLSDGEGSTEPVVEQSTASVNPEISNLSDVEHFQEAIPQIEIATNKEEEVMAATQASVPMTTDIKNDLGDQKQHGVDSEPTVESTSVSDLAQASVEQSTTELPLADTTIEIQTTSADVTADVGIESTTVFTKDEILYDDPDVEQYNENDIEDIVLKGSTEYPDLQITDDQSAISTMAPLLSENEGITTVVPDMPTQHNKFASDDNVQSTSVTNLIQEEDTASTTMKSALEQVTPEAPVVIESTTKPHEKEDSSTTIAQEISTTPKVIMTESVTKTEDIPHTTAKDVDTTTIFPDEILYDDVDDTVLVGVDENSDDTLTTVVPITDEVIEDEAEVSTEVTLPIKKTETEEEKVQVSTLPAITTISPVTEIRELTTLAGQKEGVEVKEQFILDEVKSDTNDVIATANTTKENFNGEQKLEISPPFGNDELGHTNPIDMNPPGQDAGTVNEESKANAVVYSQLAPLTVEKAQEDTTTQEPSSSTEKASFKTSPLLENHAKVQMILDETTTLPPITAPEKEAQEAPEPQSTIAKDFENVELAEIQAEYDSDEQNQNPNKDLNGDFIETTTAEKEDPTTTETIPFVVAAVVAENEEEITVPEKDAEGNFVQTTTVSSEETTKAFVFAAIVAEEENVDANGLYYETTTLGPDSREALEVTTETYEESTGSQIVSIQQSSNVNGPLVLDNVQYYDDPDDREDYAEALVDLQKLPRREDSDIAHLNDHNDIIDLQELDHQDDVKDDLLTTLVDGFLVPKGDEPAKKLENKDKNKAKISITVEGSADSEDKKEANDVIQEEEKEPSFPVSDIISGIYKLVASYITTTPKPATEAPQIPETAAISHINVHNMPRDQLVLQDWDSSETADVKKNVLNAAPLTDPFFQMTAPNLKAESNVNAHDDMVSLFPRPSKLEPARTMSPFDSPALKVQEPPAGLPSRGAAGPLPLNAPMDVGETVNAPPLPFLPGNFLRGSAPEKPNPRGKRPSTGKVKTALLELRNSNSKTREPVNIPLPDLINETANNIPSNAVLSRDRRSVFDPVEALRSTDANFVSFLTSQSEPFQSAFLAPTSKRSSRQLSGEEEDSAVNCNWNIKTEEDLYLLVTFHNLSAPFTVECDGAYIEVERENNGFDARWCGNRVTQGGSRPHVIFAKNEVRITVFDDGNRDKDLPTGFSADVEVIDLFDGQQSSNLRKTNAYSNVRKLTG